MHSLATKLEPVSDIDRLNDAGLTLLAAAASDFWFWAPTFVRTQDEENQTMRPFPPLIWQGKHRKSTYLYDLGEDINKYPVTCLLKPRRMLITWRIILRFMHRAQFAGTGLPGSSEVYAAAIMATDEKTVLEFFERIYNVYDEMDPLIRRFNPIVTRNNLLCRFKSGGKIVGHSLKQSGARGPGYTEILFDEAAFQMFARSTYAGTRPTIGDKGRIIIVSTPNGKRNWFYEVWSNQNNQYNDVHRIQITWNQHPDRDEEWKKRIEGTISKQDFAREYLCSFSTAAGMPVFESDFDYTANTSDNRHFLDYDPTRVVFLGWDLGFYNPATVIGQLNNKDQFIAQHEFFGNQEDIYDYALRLKETLYSWYPPTTNFVHFIPHDAFMRYQNRSLHGHTNDYQTLFGPKMRIADMEPGVFSGQIAYRGDIEYGKRLGAVRSMLKLRQDGRSGLVCSRKSCPELIDGFTGGYAYPPEEKIADPKKIMPEKGDYSHLHDALQMIATGLPKYKAVKKSPIQTEEDYKYIGHGIGT